MDSYASVLESYLIPAEEGLMDKIKGAGNFTDRLKQLASKIVGAIKVVIDKIKTLIEKIKAKKSHNRKDGKIHTKLDDNKFTGTINNAINALYTRFGKLKKAVGRSHHAMFDDLDTFTNDRVDEFIKQLKEYDLDEYLISSRQAIAFLDSLEDLRGRLADIEKSCEYWMNLRKEYDTDNARNSAIIQYQLKLLQEIGTAVNFTSVLTLIINQCCE